MSAPQAITLSELTGRVGDALALAPGISNVWVMAETADVRVSGGHCYMELIEKEPVAGRAVAKMRATVWASRYSIISRKFMAATGCNLASDMKVMVCVSVAFHPLYGLSASVLDINPEYTAGEVLRRRREMIDRLTREGIIDMNRSIPWPHVPLRIAVISAATAAGYGDFINQLYTNRYGLRFSSDLYQAVMQGDRAPESIIAALEAVATADKDYDCVVIIRGGGATGDLAAFDNYELAAHIAMFPIPVIIGIGHERDITLLDYVAAMRVKTPTAAAEWLIDRGADALDTLARLGHDILAAASTATANAARRLDAIMAALPLLARGHVDRARNRVGESVETLLRSSLENTVARRRDRLDALSTLIESISPEATLRRGFSITRIDGHAVTDASAATPGTTITTTLARGTLTSTVTVADINE